MMCTSVSKLKLDATVGRETIGSVFVARGELAFESAMVAKGTRDGTVEIVLRVLEPSSSYLYDVVKREDVSSCDAQTPFHQRQDDPSSP
jgi:hypothetical protein